VWDLYEGTRVCPPLVGGGVGRGMQYPPIDLVSLPAGPVLFSASGGDGRVRVWDLAAGTRIGDPLGPGGDDWVTAVKAFTADGRTRLIAEVNGRTVALSAGSDGPAPVGPLGGGARCRRVVPGLRSRG
jgi:hypothetical protein